MSMLARNAPIADARRVIFLLSLYLQLPNGVATDVVVISVALVVDAVPVIMISVWRVDSAAHQRSLYPRRSSSSKRGNKLRQ